MHDFTSAIDPKEKIEKCLSCEREECINCLATKPARYAKVRSNGTTHIPVVFLQQIGNIAYDRFAFDDLDGRIRLRKSNRSDWKTYTVYDRNIVRFPQPLINKYGLPGKTLELRCLGDEITMSIVSDKLAPLVKKRKLPENTVRVGVKGSIKLSAKQLAKFGVQPLDIFELSHENGNIVLRGYGEDD